VTLPASAAPKERWDAAREALEPVRCLGDRYEVYKSIEHQFIEPRLLQDGDPAYSMLLYGPPGTGKTTVASSLSWALDYPLITVTVSDFLADGQVAIEARAKDLFRMLQAQPRMVVLFDEVDQFMLDRDSEYFRDQETVFQFLTPGMLTKLAALRDSKSVLFIIATNYAERIDAAIKRQGRIDQHLLLLPADKERRKKFVELLWKSGAIDVDAAATNSPFLSFNDMKLISKRAVGPDAIKELTAAVPAATPDTYIARFHKKNESLIKDAGRAPIIEFAAMVALEVDAAGKTRSAPDWENNIRSKATNRFHDKLPPKIDEALANFIESTR
jgi:SpoVK/Ycf46/Vps4 family AAA+-type ATPase